jgi:hypothetical protein
MLWFRIMTWRKYLKTRNAVIVSYPELVAESELTPLGLGSICICMKKLIQKCKIPGT